VWLGEEVVQRDALGEPEKEALAVLQELSLRERVALLVKVGVGQAVGVTEVQEETEVVREVLLVKLGLGDTLGDAEMLRVMVGEGE